MANNWTSTTERYNYYGLIAPTDMQMNWIGADLLRVQWNDIYNIDVFVEVWASINGANPVLLGTAPKGATSIDITTDDSNDYLVFIRTAKDGAVSQFSKPLHSGSIQYYFIDTAGVDDPGRDGSNLAPWLTLAYACTRVTTPGEIIHVAAGTYIETVQSVLSEDVSILGADEATTIIQAGANLEPLILAQSTPQNSRGNQSISNITIDGNLTSNFGIAFRRRSNIVFDHVTIKNFVYIGLEIYGGSGFASVPTTYVSGVIIRNCTFDNCCSRRDPQPFGSLRLGGTIGAEIHDCTMTQTGRAVGTNGNLLYLWGSINKGTKFYNNVCTKPTSDGLIVGNGNGWNFHIESGSMEGFEVYGNTFVGGVALDLAGGIQVKGSYDYSWYVHDNEFSIVAQIAPVPAGHHSPFAMDFERTNEDIIVEKNKFTNYPSAINFTVSDSTWHKCRIKFNYNQFLNCGYTDASFGYGALFFKGAYTATGDLYYDIDFSNNICVANGARAFIALQTAHNMKRLNITNNVFINCVTYGYMVTFMLCGDGATPTGSFSEFRVENNVIFNNANANNWIGIDGKVITFTAYANNRLAVNPLFIGAGDYHLQAGSPCINNGKNLGLLTDFDGVTVANPPEIGCYEYV